MVSSKGRLRTGARYAPEAYVDSGLCQHGKKSQTAHPLTTLSLLVLGQSSFIFLPWALVNNRTRILGHIMVSSGRSGRARAMPLPLVCPCCAQSCSPLHIDLTWTPEATGALLRARVPLNAALFREDGLLTLSPGAF